MGSAAAGLRDWAHGVLAALADARAEIDALNVFPVPDGDTGTNVYLTAQSAYKALDEALDDGQPVASALRAMARGALLGARGNSGVILAEYLGGISDAVAQLPAGRMLRAGDAAAMLTMGAERAYRAVARPVEGTILTVARSAADAALSASSQTLAGVLDEAARSARATLLRTPEYLEALRIAGVVDAGGRAFVVILDAVVNVLQGREPVPGSGDAAMDGRAWLRSQPCPQADQGRPAQQGPAFEVMYLLDATAAAGDALRAELEGIGDSIVIAGDDGLWSVHVHVDDAGAAIEAGMAFGRPHNIRVSRLNSSAAPSMDSSVVPSMVSSMAVDRAGDHPPATGVPGQAGRAIVAVAHGPGIATLLESLGATVVMASPLQRPSTAEILGAITDTGAREVLVLPGDKDTLPVAEVAARQARQSGARLAVIPTRAVVQSLAAIAVHDADLAFDEDAVAMTRACGATRYAAVTVATRRALTAAGPCQVGDALGIVDGDMSMVGPTVPEVALGILGAMLAVGGELVTCVFGSEADEALRHRVAEWLASEHPFVDVTEVDGGQPLWPLIVGVE